MRIVWHQRHSLERKLALAEAFGRGLRGEKYRIVHGFNGIEDCDVAVLFGIGGISKEVWDAYRAAGITTILWDKGYTRRTSHYRVTINTFQPKLVPCEPKRFRRLGIAMAPLQSRGNHILFDGASNKYCQWQGLGELTAWGESIVAKIRSITTLPVIYRPRPTHNEPVAIEGTELSVGPLRDDFNRARVVVSYGGNIGVDAQLEGLPTFAIGDSIARQVSETNWELLTRPRNPTPEERQSWVSSLAYWQWTETEIVDGLAWRFLREQIDNGL